MATHELKTWPEPFAAIADGRKWFEYRRDDREPPFAVGDWLHLREWVPREGAAWGGSYTGRYVTARVDHIARGPAFGIPEGFAVLSLGEVTRYPRDDEEWRCGARLAAHYRQGCGSS